MNNIPNLRFKEFKDEWREKYFNNLTILNIGGCSNINKEINKSSPHSFVEIKYLDVYNNYSIINQKLKNTLNYNKAKAIKKFVLKNDVLFTLTSETIIDIGKSCVILNNLQNVIF